MEKYPKEYGPNYFNFNRQLQEVKNFININEKKFTIKNKTIYKNNLYLELKKIYPKKMFHIKIMQNEIEYIYQTNNIKEFSDELITPMINNFRESIYNSTKNMNSTKKQWILPKYVLSYVKKELIDVGFEPILTEIKTIFEDDLELVKFDIQI